MFAGEHNLMRHTLTVTSEIIAAKVSKPVVKGSVRIFSEGLVILDDGEGSLYDSVSSSGVLKCVNISPFSKIDYLKGEIWVILHSTVSGTLKGRPAIVDYRVEEAEEDDGESTALEARNLVTRLREQIRASKEELEDSEEIDDSLMEEDLDEASEKDKFIELMGWYPERGRIVWHATTKQGPWVLVQPIDNVVIDAQHKISEKSFKAVLEHSWVVETSYGKYEILPASSLIDEPPSPSFVRRLLSRLFFLS